MEGDDDDEDPDKRGPAMVPSDSVIPRFLPTKKIPAISADDFLAPTPHIAPPRWRKSKTKVVGIQQVVGYVVGRQDAPMVTSHCQIPRFQPTKKILATAADDFLAPTPYTAPPMWRKSETKAAGIQQVDGSEVGGCGLEVMGVRGGDVREEGTGIIWSGLSCTRMHWSGWLGTR